MIVRLQGCAVSGIKAHSVQTEVHLIQGAKFHLVGLPDSAMKEAAARLFSAIVHSGFRYPGKRITINMAPADIPKEGAAYDLPMALGILGASGQCPVEGMDEYLIMGELSLDGRLMPIKRRPIYGALRQGSFAQRLHLAPSKCSRSGIGQVSPSTAWMIWSKWWDSSKEKYLFLLRVSE